MNTVLTKLAYHFRSFPIVGHSTKQGEELAANRASFEAVDATVGGAVVKSWKRKSVEANVNVPTLTASDTLQGAELALVNDLLVELVSNFAKTQYIDAFKALGDHSLQAIIAHRAEMVSRKSTALIVPPAEALAIGAKVLTDYFVEVAPKVSPRVISSDLFKSGVTDKAIGKFCVAVDYDRLMKLEAHAVAALELVPALELGNDAAAAEAALKYLAIRVAALRAKAYPAPLEDDDGM